MPGAGHNDWSSHGGGRKEEREFFFFTCPLFLCFFVSFPSSSATAPSSRLGAASDDTVRCYLEAPLFL